MSTLAEINGAYLALPPRERLSHAYILISPAARKLELAMQLAAHMLCPNGADKPCLVCSHCRKVISGIHPDIIVVQRQLDDKGKMKREVYVAQIRELAGDSVVLPNEADYKVYVISDAEYMNTAAQNALLKLLEEPPAKVRFILCTENPGAMLDTIRSRCIELSARCTEESSTADEQAANYLRIAAKGDRLELLRLCSKMEEYSAAQLEEFIRSARNLIGDTLALHRENPGLSPHKLMEIYALLTRCLEYMQVNVGVKQLLGLISVCTLG